MEVFLYVPNLICYCRLALTVIGGVVLNSHPTIAGVLLLLTGFLDMVDGYAARKLNQTSKFGVILDVLCDVALRSMLWIVTVVLHPSLLLPAVYFISCEWLCFTATQVSSERQENKHWKDLQNNRNVPAPIQYFFSNNFRNWLGITGIGGLFVCPSLQPGLVIFPIFKDTWIFTCLFYWAWIGRFIANGIELWFILNYFVDADRKIKKSE